MTVIDTTSDTIALVRWLLGSVEREIHATKWACDRQGNVYFDMQSKGIRRVAVQQHRIGTFSVFIFEGSKTLWSTHGVEAYDLGSVFRALPDGI